MCLKDIFWFGRIDEMIHNDLYWSSSVKVLKFFKLHTNALNILQNILHTVIPLKSAVSLVIRIFTK